MPFSNRDFEIPFERDVIVRGSLLGFNNVYPANKTSDKIKGFSSIFTSSDSIFDNYVEILRTYYSVIENIDNLDWKILKQAFEIYIRILDALRITLQKHFEKNSDGDKKRNNLLAFTKIYFYFLSEIVQAYDRKFSSEGVPSYKKAKKAPNTMSNGTPEQWQGKKIDLLEFIYIFLGLPLSNLWDPPLPEESFVSLIGNICYNNMISLHGLKDSDVGETMFKILGTLIKRYNHSNSFIIQFPQAVISNESATAFLIKGVKKLYEEFELHSVVSNITKELATAIDMENSNDSYVIKASTTFLAELAAVMPKPMLKAIDHMECFMGKDAPIVRMCYLNILGDILLRVLCFDNVEGDLVVTRREFLDEIIDHIRDVAGSVRAKALQILTKLQKENAIPLRLDFRILTQAVGRLADKAVAVRKNALMYLKSFIMHKISANEMYQQSIESLQNYIEIANQGIIKCSTEIESLTTQSKQAEAWKEKEPLITEFLNEVFSEESGISDYLPTSDTVMPPQKELFTKLKENVNEKKFDEVLKICLLLESVSENFIKVREQFPLDHLPKHFLLCIKNVYFADMENNISPDVARLHRQRSDNELSKNELVSAIAVLKLFVVTFPIIETLLNSKTVTDIQEAVEFFTLAYQHLHPDIATKAVLQMLFALSYGFMDKKDIIFKAYTSMFFCPQGRTERQRSINIVIRLCKVVKHMTIGQYPGFSQIMEHWLISNNFTSDMIQVLWERFSKKHNDCTTEDTHLCLHLLIICTTHKPSIAYANLPYIESYALKEVAFNDIIVANSVMNLIEVMYTSKNYISATSKTRAIRLKPDSSLVTLIVELIMHHFENSKIKLYNKFLKSAIQLLYVCSDTPNKVMEKIVGLMWSKMYTDELKAKIGTEPNQTINVPNFILARFIFLMGEIGLNHLIYLDTTVYNELRRRKAEIEEEKRNTQKDKRNKFAKNNDRMSVISIQSAASSRRALEREANNTKDEDYNTDNEEDAERHKYVADIDEESELINHVCEAELLNLNANTMLSKALRLIVKICSNPAEYKNEYLFSVSCLSLTKLMMISSTVCRDNMKLVLSILTSTTNPEICNNLIIVLSDIAVRFPNVFAPWSQHVFKKLQDENPDIRCIVLKMLSQLLAQRLIRPKGNIAEIALCLVDPNESVKKIASTFFTELSKQHNEVYNALPEILSKLINKQDLEETKFKHIMSFLHNLIQKDRQMEGLCEKLCLRLQVCTEERQWRELAYCLSLLNVSAKSLKTLSDNANCYKDKLHCPKVKDYFKSIVDKASKSIKNDIKQAALELREKIEVDTTITETPEDPNIEEAASTPSSNKNTNTFKKPAVPRSRRGANKDSSDSSDESSEDDSDEPQRTTSQLRTSLRTSSNATPQTAQRAPQTSRRTTRTPLKDSAAAANRSTRSTRSNKSKIIDDSSEDSSDAENFDTKRVKRTAVGGKKK